MIKPGIYVNWCTTSHFCTEYSDFNLKNEPRNAKIDRLNKWCVHIQLGRTLLIELVR